MAIWTKEQVDELNSIQNGTKGGNVYKCPKATITQHRDTAMGVGVLVATESGFICRDCEYTQQWSHLMPTGKSGLNFSLQLK